jgi:putative ABC transport system substrate-binding protein
MRFGVLSIAIILSLKLLAAPLTMAGEQSAKIARIGWLWPSQLSPYFEAFRQAMRDHGYEEGQNVAFEHRYAEGKASRLPTLAGELVRLGVDIIVAVATPATHAAKDATTTIPIVMVAVGDPVGTGLVASLPRPGGNITGVATLIPELSAKRLEVLKEAFPHIGRVAILSNPANPVKALDMQETQSAAQALGVQLQPLEVHTPNDFEPAFEAASRYGAEALIVFVDPLTIAHRHLIVKLAATSRLPAMYGVREFVEDGGLMAYGVSFPDLYRRAAVFVDKILRGTRPTEIPVEQPIRFELLINLKTAQDLGVTIPPITLFRANEVIR